VYLSVRVGSGTGIYFLNPWLLTLVFPVFLGLSLYYFFACRKKFAFVRKCGGPEGRRRRLWTSPRATKALFGSGSFPP